MTTPPVSPPRQPTYAAPRPYNPQANPASTTPMNMTAAATATAPGTGFWSFHRFLAFLGLALSILSPLWFMNIGAYVFIGPMLAPTVAALVILLTSTRPWAYLATAILGALFPLFIVVGFGIIFEQTLFNPIGRAEYLATWTNIMALAFIETGAIAGFANARRKNPPVRIGAGWRAAPGTFATAVIALFVGVALTSTFAANQAATSGGGGYDFAPEATVNMVTEGTKFVPNTITVAAGKITEIVIENRDAESHTFTYANGGTEYNHPIYGGDTAKFLVKLEAAGTVKFWCEPHSRGADSEGEDMFGTLTVTA